MNCFFLILFFAISCRAETAWDPDFYTTSPEGGTVQKINALTEIVKLHLKGNEFVVDVGCGSGDIAACIAERCLPAGHIHGIDISASMIELAKKHEGRNISFECASLLTYQPAQQYDIAVCFWVLYLFDDYQKGLSALMSLIRPGGKALITHIISPATPFDQLLEKKIVPRKLSVTFPTIETIMNAIRSIDAKIEYFEIKYAYDHFLHLDDLVQSMKKIPFYKEFNSIIEAESFYKELAEVYPAEADGSVYDYGHIVCMILEKK
jgi:ubiquinone/menaquinone biosynthesis C-methylase UbiE